MSESSGPDTAWRLLFEGYDPADEGRREALCALGNGYMVTRAAAPEGGDDDVHYPGTYRAGLYNRLVSHIQGEAVEDSSLVKLPNWLPLSFRMDGGDWFTMDEVELLDYRQLLDLRHGLLHRELRFCDRQGRRSGLRERRLVSMAQPHLAALETTLTAENWSGELEILSALDGRVVNDNVARYAAYSKRHLEPLGTGAARPGGIWLAARTSQSRIEITLAARTRLLGANSELSLSRDIDQGAAWIAERIRCRVIEGSGTTIEKVAALYTSRDPAMSESGEAARQAVRRAPGFDCLLGAHKRAWDRLWARCDIDASDVDQLRAARLHSFQVLQTVSPHSAALDVGIPSRGWHGEDYRGHIFWDELFVFPFLSFRFPALARSLLLYRYRRLGAARQLAQEQGCRGAMFPWRSADTGEEETPVFQLNPRSGRWMRDHTNLQRHISAAVAYNLWHYVAATGDGEFMHDYGAELLLEIARFWASLASYNPKLDRFEIRGVVGPDEYHTAYPQADRPGIDNNAYTNLMAVWTLQRALEVLDELQPARRAELYQALELSIDELDHWDRVSRRMRVVFHDGIPAQFEGFDELQPFDLPRFREEYPDGRIDWTLGAEGKRVNAYAVAKQADALMPFYLLPASEVAALLARLGYSFDPSLLRRSLDTYLPRTAHESSLSRVVYAGVLAGVDLTASWRLFQEAQRTDRGTASGDSTAQGVHLGAMAGTLQVLQSHYLGLNPRQDALHIDPAIPKELGRLCLSVHYRQRELRLEATPTRLKAGSASGSAPVMVVCRGRREELKPGASVMFDLDRVGT